MSAERLLLWLAVLFCSCLLPVLPQSVPACEQFTLSHQVGPGMPLIIPEGGSEVITCRHKNIMISLQAHDWYREASIIRADMPEGREGCSCEATTTMSAVQLTFTDFGPMAVDQYSCRIPDPFNDPAQNVCRFSVLMAEAPAIRQPFTVEHVTQTGVNLKIPVMVDGVPFPNITWRNVSTGTVLMNDTRTTIGSTGSLTLNDLTQYDRGNYSLVLSNNVDTQTTNFSIFVQFFQFVRFRPVVVTNGKIMVTCEAIGYPTVIVGWEDSIGNMINPIFSTETQSTFEKTVTKTLAINQHECQDSYACVVSNEGGTVRRSRSISICNLAIPPPRPMNITVTQNGQDSVQVSWAVENTNQVESFDICYSASGSVERTCLPQRLGSMVRTATVDRLEINREYTFRVISYRVDGTLSNESREIIYTLVECSEAISRKVFGVSVGTTVNHQKERTFNISWAEPQETFVRGYNVSSDRGWSVVVNQKVITNLVTPANFCNGEDHSFTVMAMNNCGRTGPPSAPVVGKCATLSRTQIIAVTGYSTAITVQWTIKPPEINVKSPLSITVLEIPLSNDGRQLQRNYSVDNVLDKAECLGALKVSTFYKVCLHPVYTDGSFEKEPVCVDVMTRAAMDPNDPNYVDLGACSEPKSQHYVGASISQVALPDYAIALIVVGLLIILALVFCFVGICFACSNSRGKDIDDIGSEYSSSIAPGMQGRMSSNHNRNMSPSRSCLSYHSKGHSTNWNDHMGTLREMETEIGTNV